MAFDNTTDREIYWEVQPHSPGLPSCHLLKVRGEPYPFGSIVYTSCFNPTYSCEAFYCDDAGVKHSLWLDEFTGSLEDAQRAVERWLPATVRSAA